MALSPSATIAIVIVSCAAFCLCGYAIWAVMFKDKIDTIDNTRPQGEQAQYMREIRHKNIEAFAREIGQRGPPWVHH
jgi:hypothetical protein